MYKVELTKQAEKTFDLLFKSNSKMANRVANAIDHLSEVPDAGVPLKGELKGLYKYRVGTYRIIYQVKRKKLVITIIDIGHRREVYR